MKYDIQIMKRNYITPVAQIISLASEENVLLTMSVSGEVGGNIGSNHRMQDLNDWDDDEEE